MAASWKEPYSVGFCGSESFFSRSSKEHPRPWPSLSLASATPLPPPPLSPSLSLLLCPISTQRLDSAQPQPPTRWQLSLLRKLERLAWLGP